MSVVIVIVTVETDLQALQNGLSGSSGDLPRGFFVASLQRPVARLANTWPPELRDTLRTRALQKNMSVLCMVLRGLVAACLFRISLSRFSRASVWVVGSLEVLS